jgi:hypothetical protein
VHFFCSQHDREADPMSSNTQRSLRVLVCCVMAFGVVELAAAATIRGSRASDTLRGTAKADRLLGAVATI